MSQGKADVVNHIYTPDEAVTQALTLVQNRIDNPETGILQRIPGADFLMPLHAGELVAIVGYTSNGKSSLANYIATQHGYRLRSYLQSDPNYKHINVYVTWEQSIEEQTILDLSRVTSISASKIFKGDLSEDEIDSLWHKGARDRRSLPIWLIGSSINDDRYRIRFSMDEVNEGLAFIEKAGYTIDMIILDYLQRIRRSVRSGGELREGFMDIVDSAKDMAVRCPVILVSQAKREVRSRAGSWQLPDLDDGQETSNLEQSCDHYYSVWMPKQSQLKAVIVNDLQYTVTDKLLVVGYLKQKQGPAPIYAAYNMGYGGTYLEVAEGFATEGERKKIMKR